MEERLHIFSKLGIYFSTQGCVNKLEVLDVGCGAGDFISHLHKQGVRQSFGVDLADAIQKGHKKHSEVKDNLLAYPAEDLPFSSGSAKYIIFDKSFHHVDDGEKAMLEASRVCQRGGKVIFIEPIFNMDEANDVGALIKICFATKGGHHQHHYKKHKPCHHHHHHKKHPKHKHGVQIGNRNNEMCKPVCMCQCRCTKTFNMVFGRCPDSCMFKSMAFHFYFWNHYFNSNRVVTMQFHKQQHHYEGGGEQSDGDQERGPEKYDFRGSYEIIKGGTTDLVHVQEEYFVFNKTLKQFMKDVEEMKDEKLGEGVIEKLTEHDLEMKKKSACEEEDRSFLYEFKLRVNILEKK